MVSHTDQQYHSHYVSKSEGVRIFRRDLHTEWPWSWRHFAPAKLC